MHRGELTDKQWQVLEPLMPKRADKRGRPAQDHRTVLNGILWVLRTGAPWRDMPERYGKWTTVYSRFHRWQKAGFWAHLLHLVQSQEEQRGQVEWEVHFVDSSVVRAHQHAAGAKGGASKRKRSAVARAASRPRSTSASMDEAAPSASP